MSSEEEYPHKVNVSDPRTGKTVPVPLKPEQFRPFVGLRIGDVIDGSVVGMPGYKLRITGGTDKDGFPMRPDVHGGVKTRVLLSGPPGFRPRRRGERRRKTVRGNVITEDIAQVNAVIIEWPPEEKKPKEGGEKKAEGAEEGAGASEGA